ncbi:hypothetical protein [Streptomyces sp. NPDC059166]|uniref:hypothetical protein n=1 Tax=Streptomyces sp. NPDC059166 TaxID=3346752 RepID=UPI0036CE1FDC
MRGGSREPPRTSTWEFRHCYTVTTGRVFFELVERTGGYDGYGACNAPVRLAAQHAAGDRPPGAQS